MRKVHVQVTLLDFSFYYRTVLQRIHVARHALKFIPSLQKNDTI